MAHGCHGMYGSFIAGGNDGDVRLRLQEWREAQRGRKFGDDTPLRTKII